MSTALPYAQQLAKRVDEATAATSAGRALRRGGLRFARTVALPVGIQGPTAGVIIGPAIIASIVGEPDALAQVLALVAMTFVAYAVIVFTRAFNTTGSVYGFNAAALGPGYGFVSAWLLLLVYTSFAAGVYASTADIAQTLLASLGLHVGWVWLGLAGAALALGLAYLSIGFSSLVILACECAAVALITAVAVAVLVAGGYHHHGISAAPFSPHGVSLAVLAIQYGAYLILAAYLLTVIAALAWTWRTPRRPLPLAILAIGAAVLGYVVYRTFIPFPAAPFGWVVLAAAGSAAAGAAVLLVPGLLARLRRSPLLAVTVGPGTSPGARE